MKVQVCLLIATLCNLYLAKPLEMGRTSIQNQASHMRLKLHSRSKRQTETLTRYVESNNIILTYLYIPFYRLCDCEAVVYLHPNYNGRSLSIRHQNADFRNNFLDDSVDSIQIYGNCRWLFYSDYNFQGDVHYLPLSNFSSAPSWGGPGDQISSARVLPPTGTRAIALFDLKRYAGRMVILYQSCDDLNKFTFSNRASSFIILGGSWKLYRDKNFAGLLGLRSNGEYPHTIYTSIGDNTVTSVQLI